MTVDFDVSGAVQKLVDKELVVQRLRVSDAAAAATEPVLKVYDLPSSLNRLDQAWDDCFEDSAISHSGEFRLAEGNWPPFAEAAEARVDVG